MFHFCSNLETFGMSADWLVSLTLRRSLRKGFALQHQYVRKGKKRKALRRNLAHGLCLLFWAGGSARTPAEFFCQPTRRTLHSACFLPSFINVSYFKLWRWFGVYSAFHIDVWPCWLRGNKHLRKLREEQNPRFQNRLNRAQGGDFHKLSSCSKVYHTLWCEGVRWGQYAKVWGELCD